MSWSHISAGGFLKGMSAVMAGICALGLTACGQQQGESIWEYEREPAGESVTEEAVWQKAGFAAPGKPKEQQTLWAVRFQPWKHNSRVSVDEEKELIYLDSGVCGELFWYLGTESGAELCPEKEYVLDLYDTVSGENTVKSFTPLELGLDSPMVLLCGMDMLDREHYVLRWTEYEQDEEGMCHQIVDGMIYTDLSGNSQTTDLREAYLEKGITREESAEAPTLQSINWHCDGRGNIYVIDQKEDGSGGLYLFDPNGQSQMEYGSSPGQQLLEPLRTPEGELIFPVYDDTQKCYEFLWADREAGKLRSLGQMAADSPLIVQMYGMQGEDIYYRRREVNRESIIKWNSKSGTQEQIFDFQAAGIDVNYRTMLALREGQLPVLRLTKYKEGKPREWISALAKEKPAENGTVRVADLVSGGESKARVAACAPLASMETPDFNFEYEDVSSEEARDRILAELSQGKGPDLLYVSIEDMYMLEEKGLLYPLGELIPRELMEVILPGALEIGTVDGKLVGVPAGVRAETLAVSGDTWTEDTWRLEDVIALIEEGKLTGAIRNVPDYMMGKYTTPSVTMLELEKYALADSFLIDWENRKCHFDDERFIRLLELTGTDLSGVPVDSEVWLNEGKDVLLGHFSNVAEFLDFFAHMETEGGVIVGYPTEGSCGSYLTAEGGVLVVNGNIARKEAAVCFLETLLGEELQAKSYSMCMSVRKLIPEDYIVEEATGRLVFMGGKYAPEVPVFENGDTSLHRAQAFLESCVASPHSYFQINRIIAEELADMYASDKSPETTADNINRRVQLYLDETG